MPAGEVGRSKSLTGVMRSRVRSCRSAVLPQAPGDPLLNAQAGLYFPRFIQSW